MARKVLNGLDLTGNGIKNVADPSVATDGANKQYVDNVARGLQWKLPARAASTTNITVASPGASIDGVSLATNDRVLLKNQSTASENGIYVFNGASSPLTRTVDADNGTELAPGTCLLVTEGTTNGDKAWMIISDTAVTIGTTATVWGQFGGGTTYSAGAGLNLSGTTFAVVAGTGIIADGTSTRIDTSVVPRKVSGVLAATTSPTLVHNLGTKDVTVAVYDTSTGETVQPDEARTDVNTITFGFNPAPAAGQYRAVVTG